VKIESMAHRVVLVLLLGYVDHSFEFYLEVGFCI
jgi:hypothetical protein